MFSGFSPEGMAVVVVVIVILILVSIQFTLNQILRELREVRKKMDLREPFGRQSSYRRGEWDE